MAIIKVKDNNPTAAIRELLCSMLSREIVSAILVPQEIPSKKAIIQTLVRDPDKLSAVNPLAPVFSINSAQIISKLCVVARPSWPRFHGLEAHATGRAKGQNQQVKEPVEPHSHLQFANANCQFEIENRKSKIENIAVVLRPCEIRALVELVKLQQININWFVVVGVDCWGTYSVKDYAAKAAQVSQGSSVTADFLKQVIAGNFPEQLRSACRLCQHPAPTYADITIQLIGEDINKQITVQAQTEKGVALFDALGLDLTPENDRRKDALAKLKELKKQAFQPDPFDFLEAIASLCINCHNCRAVCPICYCKQCVFDGNVFKYPMEKYLSWSGKKGILSMPPDKLLFHLTRMSHVATSCVACGQCEAACPSGIPLGEVYQRISTAAQKTLGYEAGRSLDDELPLTSFREDELSVVED